MPYILQDYERTVTRPSYQISFSTGHVKFTNRLTHQTWEGSEQPFWVEIDGKKRAKFTFVATQTDGATFTCPEANLDASLTFEDHPEYLRTKLILTAHAKTNISKIGMVSFKGAPTLGTVPGSPLAQVSLYAGLEHPMAVTAKGQSYLERKIPLPAGLSVTTTAVFGVAPEPSQLRRAFQTYVEATRARPYEAFLHYNSWYDLGYFTRYTEPEGLTRINAFGHELTEKRGVKLSSFLFDDGWDETNTVWNFHSGFPEEFKNFKTAAAKYNAEPGIWLSPWGGYGPPRDQRLATGKAAGMEVDSQGYALSGPKYYEVFRARCLQLVKENGINQFKLDGTGSPDKQYPGSAFASDFDAAIQLISELRAAKPGLFINLTTGTWPSPFWTQFADSIWRGGSDHSFAGVGTWRQKWITYRDSDTFHGIVKKGPLYPLNSLMLHGLIYAKHAQHLGDDPGGDFADEVRTYFATGTQLQEMYITPELLKDADWDILAAGAKWSRAHQDALRDVHWVGGDPGELDVYGWAGWSASGAVLTLRNPSDKPQAFSIDPANVLELPSPRVGAYEFTPELMTKAAGFTIAKGASRVVTLQPFEVAVFSAKEVGR